MIIIYRVLVLHLCVAILFSLSQAGEEEMISAVGYKRGYQIMENLAANASEEQGDTQGILGSEDRPAPFKKVAPGL
ncbi:hypothetical protein [Candidatus Odyssella thessalonicensis]|uniref:hypothetical protein n=1 Tax=Candidatus Odyssella thessalonicensis TaxID=84647 RepID=UPI000496CCDF|nr:hypothetical protein [Candidatus Odyssella thessalonicensis]